jgi:hypothetical protein
MVAMLEVRGLRSGVGRVHLTGVDLSPDQRLCISPCGPGRDEEHGRERESARGEPRKQENEKEGEGEGEGGRERETGACTSLG